MSTREEMLKKFTDYSSDEEGNVEFNKILGQLGLTDPFDNDIIECSYTTSNPVLETRPRLTRATKYSAGYDIPYLGDELTIQPGTLATLHTGVYLTKIDPEFHVSVKGKSGLGFNKDLFVFNGTIDGDYVEKEIMVKVINHSSANAITITNGMSIAQLVVEKTYHFANEIFNDNVRTGGFGSTGEKHVLPNQDEPVGRILRNKVSAANPII